MLMENMSVTALEIDISQLCFLVCFSAVNLSLYGHFCVNSESYLVFRGFFCRQLVIPG